MRETDKNVTKLAGQDKRIIVYLLAICICVVLGPFGTSTNMEFWERVVFWTVSICSVGFFMEICSLAALQTRLLRSQPVFVRLIIGVGVGGLPGTAAIVFINLVLRPEHIQAAVFPVLWMQVSLIGLIIATVDYASNSREIRSLFTRVETPVTQASPPAVTPDIPVADIPVAAQPAETNELSGLPKTRLLERLPPEFRHADIISLSMQDHYVEVTTSRGAEMILMRLLDAIELLDDLPGAQLHRSHWAARAHSDKLRRDGRRHLLVLSDGRELPVSKSHLPVVEDMLTDKKEQA
ncbi:MAG: LytTR family DNA-binding domain-containing protein [Pseudomonadota bacterium]